MTTPTNPSPMAKTEQEGPILDALMWAEKLEPSRLSDDAALIVARRLAKALPGLVGRLRAAEAELAAERARHQAEYESRCAASIRADKQHELANRLEAELAAERARVVELRAIVGDAQWLLNWFEEDHGCRWANTAQERAAARVLSYQQPSPPAEPQQTHAGCPGGDNENTDPSPTEMHSGKLGTVPGQFPEPQQQGERVHNEARRHLGLAWRGESPKDHLLWLTYYIDQQEAAEQMATGSIATWEEMHTEAVDRGKAAEAERDELRRKLEEARERELAEAEAYLQARVDQLKLQEKLQAAEAEAEKLKLVIVNASPDGDAYNGWFWVEDESTALPCYGYGRTKGPIQIDASGELTRLVMDEDSMHGETEIIGYLSQIEGADEEIEKLEAKLQAAEAGQQHLRATCAALSVHVDALENLVGQATRHVESDARAEWLSEQARALRSISDRDQKRAATTEEQAAPAAVEPDAIYLPDISAAAIEQAMREAQQQLCDAKRLHGLIQPGYACPDCGFKAAVQAAPETVELPGGKGPDYVTRAKLAAALRKLAMCRDADTAPRHIAWQNLANELEAK